MNFRKRYFLLVLLFVPFLIQEFPRDERKEYEQFLKNHEYHPSNYYGVDIKAIPKRDRPDLGWQQNYLMTMNPSLRRPTPEVMRATQIQLAQDRSRRAGTPGTSTNPWVERGPNNVGGRTRAIAWDPSNPNRVWAGGVTGGLWVNSNIYDPNTQWSKVSSTWENLAITSVAFDPTDDDVMYIGTGEGWGTGSSRGYGIWKSTDGGITWTNLANTREFYYINDIKVRDEGGVGVLYVGVSANFYQGDFHGLAFQGLQRSTDGGTSFTQVMPDIPGETINWAIADIELDAANRIWVATKENAYGADDRGGGAILYSDNGTDWTLSTQRPNGARTEIATAPSDVNVLYALVEFENKVEEVLKSEDRGASWIVLDKPEDADDGIPADDFSRGQAWYDLILGVSPTNADLVIAGGINLFKSDNGGGDWNQLSNWYPGLGLLPYVHADHHAIVFKGGAGGDANDVLFGHDGGIDISTDITVLAPAFEMRNNNYNVTQFYSVAMHPGDGVDYYLGGTQDNGSHQFTQAGMNSTNEVTGGDGGFAFIDQTTPDFQTTSYVYNVFFRSTDSFVSYSEVIDDESSGRFINPADYDNNLHILYSAKADNELYRISDYTGVPNVQTITIPDLGDLASHIKVSPHTTESTTLFIGTGAGRVVKVTNADGGTNLVGNTTEITNNLPEGWISSIDLGEDENRILVTISNFGVVSVWESTNGGGAWINREGNLPDIPVRWGMYNPNDRTEVILATDLGVWRTANFNTGSPSWSQVNNGLANVRVDMLKYRPSDNQVVAATHGRGIFTSSFDVVVSGEPEVEDQTFDIAENSANGTEVGTIVATHPDDLALTFSIASGNTGETFAIVASGANAGRITVNDNTILDFETNPTFTLVVNVTDGNVVVPAQITINLIDVNEPPVIEDQAFDVVETAANGTLVGTVAVSDPEGDDITFTITEGNVDGIFTIDENSGEITISDAAAIDRETIDQYILTIAASDGEFSSEAFITIDILPGNQAPEIGDQAFSVNETATDGTVVGSVVATDPDDDDITFTITSGNDDAIFALDETTGQLTVAISDNIDRETTDTYVLTVEVSDGVLTATAEITITITPVNVAPIIADQSFEFFDNEANGYVIGIVEATDANDDDLTYTITSVDDGIFAINATTGAITLINSAALDVNVTSQYILTVEVSDGELTDDAQVTIDLLAFNNPPTIDNQAFAVDENAPDGTVVGTVAASDVESNPFEFAIIDGNVNSTFAIDPSTGEITVLDNAALDFEVNPQFSLSIQVTETGDVDKFSTATITINLNDINEAPVFEDQIIEVIQTVVEGEVVGQIDVADPEGDALVFSVLAESEAGVFELNVNTGEITLAVGAVLNAATTPSYSITVRVSDGEFDVDAVVTINVFETNEAPTVDAEQSFILDERSSIGTVVGTVAASDFEGNAFTYAIVDGNIGETFAIDENTGQLTVADNEVLLFNENPVFALSIEVTQSSPTLTGSGVVTINLNKVPQIPVMEDQVFEIEENQPINTVIGQIIATDLDGDAIQFTIEEIADPASNGAVDISLTGEIYINDSSLIDFEKFQQIVLTVKVAKVDFSAFSTTAEITINILDINEAPVLEDFVFETDENPLNGTAIGTVEATDDDGDVIEYFIVLEDGSRVTDDGTFSIDPATGVISVLDSTLIDFEENVQFELTLIATELAEFRVPPLSALATVTIDILDVNESPVINDQSFEMFDDVAIGAVIGRIIATDPDANTVLNFTIESGNDGNVFTLNQTTGDIIIFDNFELNANTTPQYVLEVSVTDGEFTRQATITIDVLRSLRPPVISNPTTGVFIVFNQEENFPQGSLIGTIDAVDPYDEPLVFSILEGNETAAMEISNAGELTIADSSQFDFESTRRFELKVEVSAVGSDTFTIARVRVNVIDVNERPLIVDQTFQVLEQSVNSFFVGKVVANDPDEFDFPTFSIVSGNTGGTFALDPVTGQLTVADNTLLLFATNPVFELTVTAADNEFTESALIRIELIKINAPPVIADQAFEINENSLIATVVDTIRATDLEDDPLRFIIIAGNRGNTFEVDANGILRVANNQLLDFETDSVFTLTVVVEERNVNPPKSDTATVKVTILDVNEAPVMANQSFEILEQSANNTVVGRVEATDEDAGDALAFSIVAGNTGGAFAINAANGDIRVANRNGLIFAENPVFELTIEVSDGALQTQAIVTINLLELNVPPVIENRTITIAENLPNGTVVDTLVATDPNGDALVFEISAGNSGDAFRVEDGRFLVVNNAAAIQFVLNPTFTLTITVTEVGTDPALSSSASLVINCNDVPIFNNQSFSVDENTPSGFEIGQLEASVEVGDSLVFSIVSGNSNEAISLSSSGLITINNEEFFDFERNNSLTFVARVSDGVLSRTAIITIFILDVYEPPIINDQEFTIEENLSPGALIGKVQAINPDGRELNYRIVEGNIEGAFFLNSAGTLTVANPGPINFEVNPVFNLSVAVNDEQDTVFANVRIIVLDVNDPPMFTSKIFTIPENIETGELVGNIEAFDEDGDAITYKMVGGNIDSAFAITATGDIVVANGDAIDYDKITLYTLTIEVSDGDLTFQTIVDIQITNVVSNILITSVEEDVEDKILVYPNPIREWLYVKLPANTRIDRLMIADLSGKVLHQSFNLQGENLEINTSAYRSGIYLLIINNESFKIIKR